MKDSRWQWGPFAARSDRSPGPIPAHTYTRGSRRMVVDFVSAREETARVDIALAFGMNLNALAKLLQDAVRRGEIRRVKRGCYAAIAGLNGPSGSAS